MVRWSLRTGSVPTCIKISRSMLHNATSGVHRLPDTGATFAARVDPHPMHWRDPAQDRLIDWSATMGSNDSMPGVFTITDRKVCALPTWLQRVSTASSMCSIGLYIASRQNTLCVWACKDLHVVIRLANLQGTGWR